MTGEVGEADEIPMAGGGRARLALLRPEKTSGHPPGAQKRSSQVSGSVVTSRSGKAAYLAIGFPTHSTVRPKVSLMTSAADR